MFNVVHHQEIVSASSLEGWISQLKVHAAFRNRKIVLLKKLAATENNSSAYYLIDLDIINVFV